MTKRKHGGDDQQPQKKYKTAEDSSNKAINKLPNVSIQLETVPPYFYPATTVPSSHPPLPAIQDADLATTPFKHSSMCKQNSGLVSGLHDSYERLEFLGDAYLELFATRMLFHRFALNIAPYQFTQLLQIRENIVNNDSLAEFASHYSFLEKLQIDQKDKFMNETSKSGTKRKTKVMGDIFEAFVAAVTLDKDLGIAAAENWMAALWADKVQTLSQKQGLREGHDPSRMSRDLVKMSGVSDIQPEESRELGQSRGSQDFHDKALEFLGGAYIEFFATSIVFTHFDNMSPGRMSQVTERLIKNDTLASLARKSNLRAVKNIEATNRVPKDRNRALADAYRAHIGSRVLDDERHVSQLAKDLLHLWTPTLVEDIENDRVLKNDAARRAESDPKTSYDANARALLQKRIMGGPGTKLEYEKYRDSIELKGDRLGQSRHFIALYLTGYGHERKLLSKGEGRSKAEASNWAAIEAMYSDSKELVDECETKNAEDRERRTTERLTREAVQKKGNEEAGPLQETEDQEKAAKVV